MAKLPLGLVQIYTGKGKGKTTAALGLALRALGQGLNVFIIQFMKGRKDGGEIKALEQFAPRCNIESYGRPGWVNPQGADRADVELAETAFARAREIVDQGEWDMVILDEVVTSILFSLIKEQDVLDLMKNKPDYVELVLTGHNASPQLMEQADLVTELMAIKHPYEKGIQARKGIEF